MVAFSASPNSHAPEFSSGGNCTGMFASIMAAAKNGAETSGDKNLRGGSWLWSAWTSKIFCIAYGSPKLKILLFSVWVGGRTAVAPLSMSSLLFTGRPRTTLCLPGSDGYVGLNEGDENGCSLIRVSSES
jgi:hypothetical protein